MIQIGLLLSGPEEKEGEYCTPVNANGAVMAFKISLKAKMIIARISSAHQVKYESVTYSSEATKDLLAKTMKGVVEITVHATLPDASILSRCNTPWLQRNFTKY